MGKSETFFTASNPDLDIDLPIVREWRIRTQVSVEDEKQQEAQDYSNEDINIAAAKESGEYKKEEVPRKKSKRAASKADGYAHNTSAKNVQAPIKQSRQILQDNYSNRQNSIKTEDNLNQLKTI